jgi:hypothetical protein
VHSVTYHGDPGAPAVLHQIVARAVGVAHTLDPAVRHVDLHVPAVRSVVRHLRLKVLAQAHLHRVNTNALLMIVGRQIEAVRSERGHNEKKKTKQRQSKKRQGI